MWISGSTNLLVLRRFAAFRPYTLYTQSCTISVFFAARGTSCRYGFKRPTPVVRFRFLKRYCGLFTRRARSPYVSIHTGPDAARGYSTGTSTSYGSKKQVVLAARGSLVG